MQFSVFMIVFSLAVITMANTFTAQVHLIDGEKRLVPDCVVFMPYLGSETDQVVSNLEKIGYSAQVTSDMSIEKTLFMDSDGHQVNGFATSSKKRVGHYGYGTLLLTMDGYELIKKKKRIFILKMHRLGIKESNDKSELASSTHSSFIGDKKQRQFSVNDLPRCSSL